MIYLKERIHTDSSSLVLRLAYENRLVCDII